MTDRVLYGARGGSATTSDLYTIDPVTAVPTSVGPIGFAVTGLAFDPATRTLYGVTSMNSTANPHSLITIDPVTGDGTLVGNLGLASGSVSDITFASNGNLYGFRTTATQLVSINKTTGAATVIPGDSTHAGVLERVGNKVVHLRNANPSFLSTINVATGHESALLSILDLAFASAAAYDGATMWVVSASVLYTLNLGTAEVLEIDTVFGSGGQLDAIVWSPVPRWFIEHYEHEFTAVTVGEPEIEANGALLNTVAPENLHFLWQLAEFGPSEIDYEISVSALDTVTDEQIVSLDFVRSYFQDFSLYRGTQLLMGGLLTSLNIEAGGECIKLAGKDWLHYLERRCWPYDADLSYINWPEGFRFKVAAAEVGQIVRDMLETVRDVSGNYPGPPNDLTFPSYSLKFTVDCDDTGTNRNYEIGAFETSSVFDLVRSLSQMDKSDGGFDFYMTPDRPPATEFRLVYPEIGNSASPIFELKIDEATALENMLELGYTDSGPEASHVLGVGAGTATRAGGVNKHLRIVSARTRRLDKVGDYGDVRNLPTLESKSLADLQRAWRSIHEIPILVDPADIPNFWTVTQPGQYIFVDYDLFGHRIDSVQKIVSMDVNVDLEGNERVQLGLNQFVDGGATDVASDP